MRDKRWRKVLRRSRKIDVRIEQKEQWARIRKFKASARTSLGNEARSSVGGFGEVPNGR
jgi:hypothetical protein